MSLPSVFCCADADVAELNIIIDAAAAIVDITIRPAIKTEVVVALAVGVSDFLVCTFNDISMYYKKRTRKIPIQLATLRNFSDNFSLMVQECHISLMEVMS
jgi:hypothetical protein